MTRPLVALLLAAHLMAPAPKAPDAPDAPLVISSPLASGQAPGMDSRVRRARALAQSRALAAGRSEYRFYVVTPSR